MLHARDFSESRLTGNLVIVRCDALNVLAKLLQRSLPVLRN
jgi:hypothetical protein